ncbi:hypothetical protein [Paenibacillus amylolyticus]|uniref:hypothetical protein n=1 Tax=Paenibacillus amylolyticus TaxID=1451 RepID=UPI001408822C|nr:hypothetical protein [Paenibacillus amylolyticus]
MAKRSSPTQAVRMREYYVAAETLGYARCDVRAGWCTLDQAFRFLQLRVHNKKSLHVPR